MFPNDFRVALNLGDRKGCAGRSSASFADRERRTGRRPRLVPEGGAGASISTPSPIPHRRFGPDGKDCVGAGRHSPGLRPFSASGSRFFSRKGLAG